MSALREVFARFGVDFNAGPLVTGNAAVDAMVGNLQALGNVVAGAAIVTGIASFVDQVRATGTELDRTSRALGLNATQLQIWRGVAGQAGVTAEQLTPAIQSLRRNASAAAIAGGQMARDFRMLGVTVRETSRRDLIDTPELLQRTLEGLAEIRDPTTRAAVSMRLLGESGARLGPILEGGAEGVRSMYREIEALGVLDEDVIEASSDLTREQARLDQAFLALRGRLALYVLPAFSAVTGFVVRLTSGFRGLAQRTRLLESGFAVLGTLAVAAATRTVVAWLAAAAPIIALTAAVGGLILIVDDLWSAVNGGDSVIADALAGIETYATEGEGFLVGLAQAWSTILDLITSVVQVTAQAAAGFTGLFGMAAEAVGADGVAGAAYEAATNLGEFGERDLALESDGTAVGDRAAARVRAYREAHPIASAFTSDGIERFNALRDSAIVEERLAAKAGTTVNIARIDVSGMDEAAATRVATTAVERALASERENTLDTLGGGA